MIWEVGVEIGWLPGSIETPGRDREVWALAHCIRSDKRANLFDTKF